MVDNEDFLFELNKGGETYERLTKEFLSSFEFFGKTLDVWASELMLEIPHIEDLDLRSFRALELQLIKKLEKTSNYLSVATAMLQAIEGGNDLKKKRLTVAIVEGYKTQRAKRPAASVIETLAESQLEDTASACIAAKIVKQFWKQRLDTLLQNQKILEQVGINLSVEVKVSI